MAKWRKIGELFLGLALISALMINAYYSKKALTNRLLHRSHVIVNESDASLFIREDEIRSYLLKEGDCCDSIVRKEINMSLLEEKLENHPYVQKSELFSSLKGEVYVRIAPRRPIARVFDKNSSWYWDEKGDKIPLSPHFSASVLMITGTVKDEDVDALRNFVLWIEQNEFWASRINGIEVKETGEWKLFPSTKRFSVELGDAGENVEEKMFRLKAFWKNILPDLSESEIKTIDLRYEKQVICRK